MKEGVRKESLTRYEKFVEFERMASYVVPQWGKHQIVHNEKEDDIGIAISRNGRADFRKHRRKKVYWYTGPYAYRVEVPMKSQGITVDLSHLV